jgi:hypothetical protein
MKCKTCTKRRAFSRAVHRTRGAGFDDNLTRLGNAITETSVGKAILGHKYVEINPAQAALFRISDGKLTNIGRQTETIKIIGVNFKTPITDPLNKTQTHLLKAITKPTALNELIIVRTNISKISKFPSVRYITCVGNRNLKELPDVPKNLININCMRNALTKLPALSHTKLVSLECQGNPLIEFPEFPPSLVYINAARNDDKNYPAKALEALIAFKKAEPDVNVVMLDALNHNIAMSIMAGVPADIAIANQLAKHVNPESPRYTGIIGQSGVAEKDADVVDVDVEAAEEDAGELEETDMNRPEAGVELEVGAEKNVYVEVLVGEIEGSGAKSEGVEEFINNRSVPRRELGNFAKRYIEVMELKNKTPVKQPSDPPVGPLVENDVHRNNLFLTRTKSGKLHT